MPNAGDSLTLAAVSQDLLSALLREVSRSFYLTLRILPPAIRPPISLAYLLARASDTIADTAVVPAARRLELLREMRAGRIQSVRELAGQQALPAERVLLERLDECDRRVTELAAADQALIRELLTTIITGQIFDLERFPGAPLTAEELDRYTYLVAGCVGEFWTKMCQAHLPGLERLSVADGIRFGKGLQLVNILRDREKDLALGRQYVVDEAGGLAAAAEHLEAGWRYTLAIPATQKRLRLACIWPIWIGLKTLARLRLSGPGAKVSRAEVYWIMLESALVVGNDAALDEVYERLRSGT
ncbi:MAG: hypothetical protein PCFJNLEI_01781 [Verrucomicrobiae bacterium]|nr:hypothetical protein [Verrucomicrobiae bacterium]